MLNQGVKIFRNLIPLKPAFFIREPATPFTRDPIALTGHHEIYFHSSDILYIIYSKMMIKKCVAI